MEIGDLNGFGTTKKRRSVPWSNLFEGQGIKQSNFTVVSNDLQGKLWNEHGIGSKIRFS